MAEANKKKLQRSASWMWLAVAFVILIAVSGWLLKSESQEAKSLKADLQAIITQQLGEKNNLDKKRIDGISVSRVSEGWNVELALNADKGFTMVSTKQAMWQQAIAILAPLSDISKLNDISISWIFPVEDSQNDVNDKSVMSFRMDKATRDQLIWGNVEPSILPDIVFDYTEHPVLNQ
ncbi:hypothetical protein ACRC6Q_11665 [Planococcus sp. SE5232]|uniref:hypothetical protein n=1 Tax=unclassified Planococcus (in: firmicutes) TaxID=2662419 RepID=UPI001CC06D94|nr:hypothetical protein [Planococcus sp. 4-30]